MIPTGRGELQLDESGLVKDCCATVPELVGAADGAQVIGQMFSIWFVPEHRPWLAPRPLGGWTGVEERVARTLRGRSLRLCWNGSSLTLLDESRLSVLQAERELSLADRAVLDLVPVLRRELNDPMSIVLGRLELLLELGGSGKPSVDRHLNVALDHARKVSNTLHLLRVVGRSPPACSPQVLLSKAVEEALAEVGDQLVVQHMSVPPLRIASDPEALVRGLTALLLRLVDRAAPASRLFIRAEGREGRIVLELRLDVVSERPELDWPMREDPRTELGIAGAAFERFGIHAERCRRRAGICYRLTFEPAVPVDEVFVTPRPVVWIVGLEDPGELLARALGKGGCRVVQFADAEGALQQLVDHRPSGILTALSLPGRSGFALVDVVSVVAPELLSRCVIVARSPVEGLPAAVAVLRPPVEPDAVLRRLGCLRE
ncbi:MAG: response regulator [Deltaproteobacteria bacterium]|nr:MAG: response regulator [Deltaproteobacteria bacterium]